MIKRKIGFFGSYTLGLPPSNMPAWGVARRVDVAEAAEELAAAVFETREMEDMGADCERQGYSRCSGEQNYI
jgi:hypothetical protein